MKPFTDPGRSIGNLDAEAAAALLAVTADIAIVVDNEGVIRDLAFSSEELTGELHGKWVGRPWIETVTVESRPKVEALLRNPTPSATPRWRHINHPSSRGSDVPILYSTMRLGQDDRVIAVGRDLQATAALQKRLVDVQQSMERDYSRFRHVETRYRVLFQVTPDSVLILDAASRKIVEVNPAAARLLNEDAPRLVGRVFPESFDAEAPEAIATLLASVRATGRPENARARWAGGDALVSAYLFRQESTPLLLIRLAPITAEADSSALGGKAKLLDLVQHAPDGFVVTDDEGRIVTTNAAFLDLAQLAMDGQAKGESLDRWLGRPGVDLGVLMANLRQHGSCQLFATTLRGEYGARIEIEVSAVALPDGDRTCFGFTIRNVGRRVTAEPRLGRELPRSVEQLTELVGRVPLKDLVRETTDVIERLCIEAALEITGDNRASAAEILGLSRQSLYVKLRRYGLGDLEPAEEA